MATDYTNLTGSQNKTQYFSFAMDAPDALYILNRGTSFQQDITGDARSATTSHSVDSIAGSFNLTLDNTNDIYVDRFGYCYIKKMSSIEIFVKSFSNVAGPSSAVSSDRVAIPASVKNLNEFINVYYNNPTPNELENYKGSIISLNQSITTPAPAYRINKLSAFGNSDLGIATIGGVGNVVTITYNRAKKKSTTSIVATKIITDSQSELIFTIGSQKDLAPISGIVEKIVIDETFGVTNADFLLGANDTARMDKLRQAQIKVPLPINVYQRIFLGVVLNVSQSITPGSDMTITLSGKTSGYWMESSTVNISPTGFETTLNNLDLTVYNNRLAATHALDIFKDLIKFSSSDLTAVTDFSLDTTGSSKLYLEQLELGGQPILDAFGDPIMTLDEKGNPTTVALAYKDSTPSQQLNALQGENRDGGKQDRLYQGIPLAAPDGTTISTKALTGSSEWTRLGNKYAAEKISLQELNDERDSTFDSYARAISLAKPDDRNALEIKRDSALATIDGAIDKTSKLIADDKARIEKIPEFQKDNKGIQKNIQKIEKDQAAILSAGRNNFLNQFGVIDHWKPIFSKNILEVVDVNNFLNLVYPFKWVINSPGFSMDGDYISKADLSRTIAENLMYEFYMDTNGHFVLKPPFYNIGIPVNDPTYIVEENELISLSINDSAEGIITRIGVAGDYNEAPITLEKLMIYNVFQDMNLIRDYGFHNKEIAAGAFLRTNADCRDFGKAFMIKNNMELFNASVTITGRPEIRLGTSLYIKPRDTVFYIREISHQINAGGEVTTTLTLIGGRRIVTGFKANTSITRFPNDKTKPKDPNVASPQPTKTDVVHYILSSATDQQALSDTLKSTPFESPSQQLTDRQKQVVSQSSFSNGLIGAAGAGIIPVILKEVYQILSHSNPAYIGLIIDKNADAISDINAANYDLFKNLTVDKVGHSVKELGINKQSETAAIDIIKNQFDIMVKVATPKDFTINLRDQFVLNFLKYCQGILSQDKVVNAKSSIVSSIPSKKTLNDTASAMIIFNNLINQLDNNGLYRQYTDAEGRELPAYLDYGKSLLIMNDEITLNQFTTLNTPNSSTKQQSLTQKAGLALGKKQRNNVSNTNALIKPFLSQLKAVPGFKAPGG